MEVRACHVPSIYNCVVISPKNLFSFAQVAQQALLEVEVEERACSINGAMEVEL